MVNRPPSHNVQSGVLLPPSADPQPEHVGRGERADDVRYQPDPDQIVRARHTQAPDSDLPPDIPSDRGDEPDRFTSPSVTDVAIPQFGPSVWEALPEGEIVEPAPAAAPAGPAAPAPPTESPTARASVHYRVFVDTAARRWRVERDGQLLESFRTKAEAVDAANASAFTEHQTGGAAEVEICGSDAPVDFAARPVPPQGQ